MLADNLGGPHIDTVRSWTKKNSFQYDFSNPEKNIRFIASLYKKCKEQLGESRDIPYLKAEDETGIIGKPTYDEKRTVC